MKNFIFTTFAALIISALNSQVIWTDPAFPTQEDQVTLYYNATQGNGDLTGVVPIYIHTGVITSSSTGPNDWQNVVGNWGTNDAQVLMSPQGNNIHTFDFGGLSLEEFYGIEAGEVIEQLACVFRNVNGNIVGRSEGGGDIFFPLSDGGFSANFSTPTTASTALELGASLNFIAQSSSSADLVISVNGDEVASANAATQLDYTFEGFGTGSYTVVLMANDGQNEVTAERSVLVLPASANTSNLPAGTQDGINYISESSVVLRLFAPGKDFIFVVGDFNDWQFDLDYLMNVSPDGNTYWLQIDGLTAGQEYRFHYHVMPDNIRIADPYAEKVLDFWNDPWIDPITYPALIEFPSEFTSTDPVSVLQTAQSEFAWTDEDFVKPAKERLIIYELLVRDFVADRRIATIIDSLDYFERLGINAIQLMPFNEFEGNNSWGYNPSFFFAPDKAYGTPEDYKNFVNECHSRGIAVIMDIALNHSFGQNPQVRMWFNPSAGQFGEPTTDNPYFNPTPRHDFNVGYDYNHEAPVTRAFAKRVLQHWVEEYHIDGYRMDLSKGFTQNNTLGNIGAWNAYDQSRVNILNDYKNHVWSIDNEAYMILEHFADNSEETVLSNDGFMLWGNLNHEYGEASMGYTGNFSWGSYQNRGWSNPHLITYAESHDEERMMYKNLNFGASQGSYNIAALNTALARQELAHVFLIPIPGPKMIWQFGEVGYDFSINYCEDGTISPDCRLSPKPVRWDYPENANRQRLFRIVGALNHLKQSQDAFSTTDFNIDFGGTGKRIHLNHSSMNVTIIGNFDVTGFSLVPGFQHTGTWYDYFTGEALEVTDLNAGYFLAPGQYHVFTDVQLDTPDLEVGVADETITLGLKAWPNPFNHELRIDLSDFAGQYVELDIFDLNGRMVESLFAGTAPSERTQLTTASLAHLREGMYFLKVTSSGGTKSIRLIKAQ